MALVEQRRNSTAPCMHLSMNDAIATIWFDLKPDIARPMSQTLSLALKPYTADIEQHHISTALQCAGLL